MSRKFSNSELYTMNTVSVKTVEENREYNQLSGVLVKTIQRTRYLKLCWMCGKPYESNRRSSFACQPRCGKNIFRYRQNGLNPPANMEELVKPKNVKIYKEEFGYR